MKFIGRSRELREKCERANLPDYDICYGLFSRSGFTEEMKPWRRARRTCTSSTATVCCAEGAGAHFCGCT